MLEKAKIVVLGNSFCVQSGDKWFCLFFPIHNLGIRRAGGSGHEGSDFPFCICASQLCTVKEPNCQRHWKD